MIELSKPTLVDIPEMQALVAPEIQSGVILERDDNEVATSIRSYSIARDEAGMLAGFLALHLHTPKMAEIRSMIVHESLRGRGVGKQLITYAMQEAARLHVQEVFVLTYHREIFERQGFKEIPKESMPEQKVWSDCIKCKHFPICNEVLLIKTL